MDLIKMKNYYFFSPGFTIRLICLIAFNCLIPIFFYLLFNFQYSLIFSILILAIFLFIFIYRIDYYLKFHSPNTFFFVQLRPISNIYTFSIYDISTIGKIYSIKTTTNELIIDDLLSKTKKPIENFIQKEYYQTLSPLSTTFSSYELIKIDYSSMFYIELKTTIKPIFSRKKQIDDKELIKVFLFQVERPKYVEKIIKSMIEKNRRMKTN